MSNPVFTGFPSDWPSNYYYNVSNPGNAPWQCTVWAAWRYHQLTGVYVPEWGNAMDWTGNASQNSGYSVTTAPVVPCIACLQPGVDGAFAVGHVCVVESINNDGTVTTSNFNWGVPDGSTNAVEMVNHKYPQTGLAFIYLKGTGTPGPGGLPGTGNIVLNQAKLIITPNEELGPILTNIDTAMELTNPFDVTQSTEFTIFGVSIPGTSDPLSYVVDVLANIGYDFAALLIRGIFLLIGVGIIMAMGQGLVQKYGPGGGGGSPGGGSPGGGMPSGSPSGGDAMGSLTGGGDMASMAGGADMAELAVLA